MMPDPLDAAMATYDEGGAPGEDPPAEGGPSGGGGGAGGAGGGTGAVSADAVRNRISAAAKAQRPLHHAVAEAREDLRSLRQGTGGRPFRQAMDTMLASHPCYESVKQHCRFVASQMDDLLASLGELLACNLAVYQSLQREYLVQVNLLNNWGSKPSADANAAAAAETMRFTKVTTLVPGSRTDEFYRLMQAERKASKSAK